MTIPVAQWLRTFTTEYVDEFLPDGGATVKFLVGDLETRRAVIEALRTSESLQNYLVLATDTSSTKAHFIDQLFFSVGRQVDWLLLAEIVRNRAIEQNGYELDGQKPTFAGIAHATGIAANLVRNTIQRWLSDEVFRDYRMTQEFRLAMMQLCLEPMSNPHHGAGDISDLIVNWLEGDLRLVSALKPAHIYQKIARHTARDTFVSLTHWVRVAGYSGTVLIVDISAYLARSKAAVLPGAAYYSRAATMDLYEVLRQFIDSVDELDGAAIIVTAAPEFLNDDDRGLRLYRALESRVAEEIRDRQHDNPVATLVRLGANA